MLPFLLPTEGSYFSVSLASASRIMLVPRSVIIAINILLVSNWTYAKYFFKQWPHKTN